MIVRKIIAALIMVSVSFCAFAQQPQQPKKEESKKPRIAVLDLTAAGMGADAATTVTDILTTELVNSNMFDVIERMQVAKILNEQGFQLSGVTDSSKAAEVGKLLNTKRVLIGTVSKLGEKFIINAKIVDVEKAKIDFAEKQMADSEGDLVYACEDLTRKLVFNITGVKLPPRTTKREEAKKKDNSAVVKSDDNSAKNSQAAAISEEEKERKKESEKKKRQDALKNEKDPVKKGASSKFDDLEEE